MINDAACIVCTYTPSEQYVDGMREACQYAARLVKAKYMGFILPCPQCLPPVVLPKVFQ